MQRIVKPKTRKGKVVLVNKGPKIVENNKTTMVMRGIKANQVVQNALRDLYSLKKPDAVMMTKKNDIRPFEDPTPLERHAQKSDCSLFLFGTNSKKRPNNLIIGRTYDHQILDMFELGADHFSDLKSFKASKCALGNKPCLIFNGLEWDETIHYKRLKNLFIDFFRGPKVGKVRLVGIEHAMTFTISSGQIFIRNYRILLKKSGSRTPRVELEEMGPSFNLVLRRHKLASDSLFKETLKIPRVVKPKKKKNINIDAFGTKLGRVHMQKQDMKSLHLRKLKGLKKDKPVDQPSTEKTTEAEERMDDSGSE